MYNVLDVCRYIINYSNKKDYGISNLKLQKILYLVQAYFLINEPSKKCFKEKIEAWDFGPVVPEAYREYKQYGSGDIPSIKTYINFDDENIWDSERVIYDDDIICNEDKEMINEVVDEFSDYSATTLVSLTHHQRPWTDAYQPNKNNEITTESIREYFNE